MIAANCWDGGKRGLSLDNHISGYSSGVKERENTNNCETETLVPLTTSSPALTCLYI